jgi:D-cysteine desulfhydrase family pyridoxal phosphate-dependent enzyme
MSAVPAALAALPRVRLAHLPTPVEPMDRLAAALGLPPGRLFVKRDDTTGLALGGNKVRKLEFLCAEAIESGCDWLVTGAGRQSNHARATAAAAAKLGLGCTLVLDSERPSSSSGNALLDLLLGADVRWTTEQADPSADLDDHFAKVAAALAEKGHHPYVVPVGGSVPLGAAGYALAAFELREQQPDVARVFVATGSAGTHAGLVAGLGDHRLVQGVRVGTRQGLEQRVEEMAAATAALIGCPAPAGNTLLDSDQLGGGYAAHTDGCAEAIRLAARTEGLVLDPVYTGKTMAGLISAVRRDELPDTGSVVMLHTGGAPGLLSAEHAPWAESIARGR